MAQVMAPGVSNGLSGQGWRPGPERRAQRRQKVQGRANDCMCAPEALKVLDKRQ